MRHVLFALSALSAISIIACGDSSSSAPENPEIPSSSSQVDVISSSSLADSAPSEGLSSSSAGSALSEESSSSQESISSADEKQSLPFDTLLAKADHDKFRLAADYDGSKLESYQNIQKKKGVKLEHIAYFYAAEPYCQSQPSETGLITTKYAIGPGSDHFMMTKGDSLVVDELSKCDFSVLALCQEAAPGQSVCDSLEWNACRGNSGSYLQKITVNGETFYYANEDSQKYLVKLGDSTFTKWEYPVAPAPDTVAYDPWNDWSMIAREDSTLRFEDRVLYIDKYKLAIKDQGETWMFENDTCSTLYTAPSGTSKELACNERQSVNNDGIACIQRNMGVTNFYPRLCRPNTPTASNIWCILDQENPEAK